MTSGFLYGGNYLTNAYEEGAWKSHTRETTTEKSYFLKRCAILSLKAHLVKRMQKLTLNKTENSVGTENILEGDREQPCRLSLSVRALGQCLPESGAQTLLRFVKENLHITYENANDGRNVKIEASTLAYIPEFATATLESHVFNICVLQSVVNRFKM